MVDNRTEKKGFELSQNYSSSENSDNNETERSGNAEPWPTNYGAKNKIVIREEAIKARDRLRAILSQVGPVRFTGARADVVNLNEVFSKEQSSESGSKKVICS